MITFKKFLSEKTMNGKTYSDAVERLGNVALVGFEFEVVVAPSSDLFVESDSDNEPDWNALRKFGYDDLDDLQEYFDMSRSDLRKIKDDFEEWVDENRDQWVDDNWHDFVESVDNEDDDEDDKEELAREKAKAHFEREGIYYEYTGDDWIKEKFGNMYYLLDNYSIEPIYGWRDPHPSDPDFYMGPTREDTGPEFEPIAEKVALSLTKAGIETHVGDPGPDYNHWGIVRDGSLPEDYDWGQGIEVISAPEAPQKAFELMDAFFKWMDAHDVNTTAECGLHIGVSIPNIKEKLDPLKLAVFMGEDYLLKMFGRTGNVHVYPMLNDVLKAAQKTGFVPNQPEEMFNMARDAIESNAAKYRTANITKLPKGYIEFRIAGGKGYQHKSEKIKQVIGRYLAIIELACDPQAERQEYIKKVTKLLNLVRFNMAGSAVFDNSDFIGPNFSRFINKSNQEEYNKALDRLRRAYEQMKDPDEYTESAKKIAMAHLMSIIFSSAVKLNIPLTAKEIASMKALAKQMQVDLSQISSLIGDEVVRQKMKKDLRI